MGSPISGTLAEIYLQYFEKTHLKHYLETWYIIYYKRCVDDLLITFDQMKTNEDVIHNIINSTDEQLEFKTTKEENQTTNYLDLAVNRICNNIELSIYRKPPHIYIDIATHFLSKHPHDHKKGRFP